MMFRFNVLHTPSNNNFDRIAYLAKMVFSMKIVVVSVLDADEE